MGNCLRRGRGASRAQADGALLAQLDAVLSLRKQPAKRRPGSEPPSSHDAALAALRYRFGCRWHCLHALRVASNRIRGQPVSAPVKLAFLCLRARTRQQYRQEKELLQFLKLAAAVPPALPEA